MKRVQKIAWFFVITISVAVVLTTLSMILLYWRYGWPKASAGLGFLGIAGIGGLSPLFFKKDPGPVKCDERDREIARCSALMGFTAAYVLVGLACVVPFFIYGSNMTIRIIWLPMIFMSAGIAHYFFYSLGILIQYGRGGKENE